MAATEPVRALAARCYTDAVQFEREREQLFFRTWQYAGHVSQLEKRGDYFAFELLGQGVFCIRDHEDGIRAFYNVCQHRAHELVKGSGNKRVLVCPYHAWTYELDGRLRAAPAGERVPGFDCAAIGLTPVRTEILSGFIFVNLDPHAAPMAAWYPEVDTLLRAYVPDIDRLAVAYHLEVTEQCNWKVTVENYNECYHCRLNHPTFSTGVVDPQSYNVVPHAHCLRHATQSVAPDEMTYAIDANANEHALEYSSWFLWPAFSFQVYPGNVLNTYLFRPIDVGTTLVVRDWFSPGGEPSMALEALARQDRETTVAEDIALVEAVQRGLRNRGYEPSPLIVDPAQGVNSEHSIAVLHGWLREALD